MIPCTNPVSCVRASLQEKEEEEEVVEEKIVQKHEAKSSVVAVSN